MNTVNYENSGSGAANCIIALLIVAAALLYGNAVAGTMTVATGGSAISADTTSAAGGSGAWTTLTGPSYLEAVKADLLVGTVILTAPAGFEFNIASPVTVRLDAGDANANKNINKTAIGGIVDTATVTATTITWTITAQSGGNTMDQITWLGIQVRPTAGSPLATGNIIPSGTSGIGAFAASAGTLTEVAGALNNFLVEASGGGPIGAQTQNVAFPIQITARDQFNNTKTSFTGTVSITSSCTLAAGGGVTPAFTAGVLNPRSITISNTGTCTITATNTAAPVVAGTSNSFAVNPVVNSFNAVEPGANAVTGKIFTKIAGQNFALDIVALDASNAISTGFTGTVAVEVVDNTSGGACSGLPLIGALTNQTFIAGDAGRHPLSSPNTVANVWRNAKVRIKYPAGAPTVTSCSGDNFAIRPSGFTGVSVTDLDWQTAGTTRTLANTAAAGGNVHKAGQPFTLQATAVNAAAATTTNYTGTPAALLTACAGTACTATFGTAPVVSAAVLGVINTGTATYNEAGSFALQLQDQTFANVDAADSSTAQRYISSAVIDVGRFVPDHFSLSAASIVNRADLACPGCTFTYLGEQMNAVFTLTAQAAGGSTTQNYAGVLAKLNPAAAGNPLVFGAVNSTATPTYLTARLNTASAASGSFALGVVNVSAPLGIFRCTAITCPANTNPNLEDGPYAALDIGIAPVDSDGVIMSAYDLDTDAVAGNDHSKIARTEVRYGRIKLSNAHGSELLPLPVAATIQYWDGTTYVTSATDSATQFNTNLVPGGNVQAANFNGPLALADVVVVTPGLVTFTNGLKTFKLAAPNKTGSVDLTIVTAPGYLLPSTTGRATFGVYKGANEFIYQRENY